MRLYSILPLIQVTSPHVNRASGYVYTCLKVRSPSSFTQKILTWMGLSFCSLDWL
ncbi:unnamed protein product [Brassica oleracea var. botrytis]